MAKSTKELIGARIQELRKSSGYTQEDLAGEIGVDPKHVSKIETGGSYPSLVTLEKIAEVLQYELKAFFEFDHLQSEEEINKHLDLLINKAMHGKKPQLVRLLKVLVE